MLTKSQARKIRQQYAAERQPWRSDRPVATQETEALIEYQLRHGAPGPHAGQVIHRMSLPTHEETTAQLCGLYPFLAGQTIQAPGAYIGRDKLSRGAFCFDPFEFYPSVLSNPNILIAGVIGSGKSSLLKTMCLRLAAFGIKFVVPADTKGEMAALATKLGAPVVQLGPGMASLNPLWAPRRPDGMDEDRYVREIESHRLLLLRALGETASGRPLTAIEDTMLDLSLSELTRQHDSSVNRLATPTLPDLVDLMLSPTQGMASSVPIELDLLKRESLNLALRFRSMVRGSLRGVFDGRTVDVDLDAPGFVIDISRIRASDAAVALTMTCGQALTDLMLTFSNARWLKVLDECWRQIRYPAIVRRISEGQKLARGDDTTTGSATLIALHRISDLMGAGPEVRDLAMGLLADTSTRIIYSQASDQLEATREALSLTDVEASLLPGLGQGTALWKVGQQHSAVVDHIVLRDGLEWPLIRTDSRMGDGEEYRSLANPRGAMSEEIGEVA